MDNFRFYNGVNQENLKKAIDELKKEGHSVTDIRFRDVEDQFIVFYNNINPTKPSVADLQRDIHGDVPPYYSSPNNPTRPAQHLAIEYLREYWYVAGLIAFGIFYYLSVYR